MFDDFLATSTAKKEVPWAGRGFLEGFLGGKAKLSSRDQVGCARSRLASLACYALPTGRQQTIRIQIYKHKK